MTPRNDGRTVPSKIAVWVVVRFNRDAETPDFIATVKEVLPSKEEAEREAARLNRLVSKKPHIQYFAQPTRFYPEGRGTREAY